MINSITDKLRLLFVPVAKFLNKITAGHLSPNTVSLISLLGHFALIVTILGERWVLSAALLIIFGLLDAVDGALARVQGKSSSSGMLLDASLDRVKESLIYIGFTLYFADIDHFLGVAISIIALSGSLTVSYIKAKGETAIASSKNAKTINKQFASGLMQYHIRMAALVVGMLLNQLVPVILAIAILSWITAVARLLTITKQLNDAEN